MNQWDAAQHGDHLAIAASIRMLAMALAKQSNATDPKHWFVELGERTFAYVDQTSNPEFGQSDSKAVKEAAYDTLRLIFDPDGFEE